MTQLETGAQQLGVMMARGCVHNAWPLAPPCLPLPFLSFPFECAYSEAAVYSLS